MIAIIFGVLGLLVLYLLIDGRRHRSKAGLWQWRGLSLSEAQINHIKGTLDASANQWSSPDLNPILSYYHFRPDLSISSGKFGLPGRRLFVLKVRDKLKEPVRGHILIVHGYMAHVGHYGPMVNHLVDLGYGVILFDLPGHGLSDGPRNGIRDFHEYGNTITAVLDLCQDLSGPLQAFSHSTGCSALFDWLLRNPEQKRIQQVFFGAPLIRTAAWTISRKAVELVGPITMPLPRIKAATSRAIFEANFRNFTITADPLISMHFDAHWITALVAWNTWLASLAPKSCSTPISVFQGTSDDVVDWRYNLPVLDRLAANLQIEQFEGICHNIWHERPEELQSILELLDARMLNCPDKV